ncbi:MAG: autotransporter domain-containing protein [Gemmataceae bacterium]|nr:autotransporter domain-containing protein [Gemmataceae bacterium]
MRLLAIAFLSCFVLASPAAAQRREVRHDGFWVAFGVGAGSNLTEGYSDARLGGAGYVRLGGTVSPRLLIGGEAMGWVRDQNGTTWSQGNATATVLLYPVRRGVYLKGGLGFASRSAQRSSGETTTTTTAGGFGATLGGGYDLQIGNNLFLTPNIDFLFQAVESEFFTATTGYLVLFTVGLTWH